MAKELDLTFAPVASAYQYNRIYRSQIYLGVLRNLANAVARKPLLMAQRLRHPIKSLAQDIAGISQAISIREVCRLFSSFCDSNNRSYDVVVILRPDVVILRRVSISEGPAEDVRCNNYGDRCGDFRWVLPATLAPNFTNLYSSIFRHSRIHEPHVWIRDYFDYLGIPYSQDEIRAGHDEEVLRKTKESGVSFARLKSFGLEIEEYDSYPG